MNENIDLTKILKGCPKGWKFWSPIFGEIEFCSISEMGNYPIIVSCKKGKIGFSKGGLFDIDNEGAECLLFPSKDQRDWSKFTALWYKKDKFDPKTLNPFDRVLVRNSRTAKWRCEHFSYFKEGDAYPYMASTSYTFCVPYNDDTKHLVGTDYKEPEYYRCWDY